MYEELKNRPNLGLFLYNRLRFAGFYTKTLHF